MGYALCELRPLCRWPGHRRAADRRGSWPPGRAAPTSGSAIPITWARRLKMLRPFARWMQQFEPAYRGAGRHDLRQRRARLRPTSTPSRRLPTCWPPRVRSAARGLRGVTYETLFGLLAATGLRVSEALHLLDVDVDLKSGLLTVRRPSSPSPARCRVHPSTVEALRSYRRGATPGSRAPTRRRSSSAPAVGVGCSAERAPSRSGLRSCATNWAGSTAAPMLRPRIHDLRHTFVVRRLLRWQAAGRRHRPADAGPVHLRRSRQGDQHLLVPDRRARAHGAGRRAVRALRRSPEVWHD